MSFEDLKEKITEKLEKNKQGAIFLDVNALRCPVYTLEGVGKPEDLVYIDREGKKHIAWDYSKLIDFRTIRGENDSEVNERIKQLSEAYHSFIIQSFKQYPSLRLASITMAEVKHYEDSCRRHTPLEVDHPDYQNRNTRLGIATLLNNTLGQINPEQIFCLGLSLNHKNFRNDEDKSAGEADEVLFMNAVGYGIRYNVPIEIWTRDHHLRDMKRDYDVQRDKFGLPPIEIRTPYVGKCNPIKSSRKKSLKLFYAPAINIAEHIAA